MTMTTKQFAKGTVSSKGSSKIFFGSSQQVEERTHNENCKYWSINYYETIEEMDQYIEIDREFTKDVLNQVDFVAVG